MKQIILGQGRVALVDDEDYELVSPYIWKSCKEGNTYYARRYISGVGLGERMHRIILEAPDNLQVDHIDGDGLNNQRSNLRLCSQGDNLKNQRLRSNNSSGYKGVYWDAATNKYRAQVQCDGKRISAGSHQLAAQAGRAYDKIAKQVHGEFARLNFPDEGDT